jgi:hypothetical protein
MHRLTETQEATLIEWIISRDIRGVPPRPCHVREMANIILQEDTPTPPPTNWKELGYTVY